MRDPLDELKNLSTRGLAPKLPPAEVRRRGDRMRRRRTALQAVGAAAAVAVIASGGAFVTGSLTTTEPPVGPATSTSPSASASAAPAVQSEIPEDFPIAEGIAPTEGLEDVLPEEVASSDLGRDDAIDQGWYGLPCSGADKEATFPGDDRRTAARRVWIEGDFWAKSRQLVVYEDYAAAERAVSALEKAAEACVFGDPPPGSQPLEWDYEWTPGNETTPSWLIAQGSTTADGSHPFFVDLTATQVGRSVFVSWSGRGQKERLPWLRLEDSHGVVLRAAWCLWMEGPCGDESVDGQPEPSATDQPVQFENKTIARGLPEPGGDVPEWAWAEGEPLSPVACGGAENLPAEPTGNYRVEVFPPDENAWRHLLVFRTEQAAVDALEQLRSSAVVCNELVGSATDEDPTDPAETRWTLVEPAGSPAVLGIDGLTYADGTDTLVPGRTLTRAVQVGRALLVAQVSDASTAGGGDEVAARLTEDVRSIAEEMCIFTEGPCAGS